MIRYKRFVGLTCLSLSLVSLFIVYRKARQHDLAAQFLNEGHAVQFKDGGYCESIQDLQKRSWLFDTIDVVYIEVPRGSTQEAISRLTQLPSLTRVMVRFQGDNFEHFRLHRAEIENDIALQCGLVRKTIPNVEVLSVWAVGQVVNPG